MRSQEMEHGSLCVSEDMRGPCMSSGASASPAAEARCAEPQESTEMFVHECEGSRSERTAMWFHRFGQPSALLSPCCLPHVRLILWVTILPLVLGSFG